MIKNGTDTSETLQGGSGDDFLDGGLGDDWLMGGVGSDVLRGGDDHPGSGLEFGTGAGSDVWGGGGGGARGGGGGGTDWMGGGDEMFFGYEYDGNVSALVFDWMEGGEGDDTYVVGDDGDVVVELAGEGTDEVIAGVGYTLSENVERLSLSGNEGISGTGNGLSNTLSGNVGANRLDGMEGDDSVVGGGGNDTLVGGVGADTLVAGLGLGRVEGGVGTDVVILDWAGVTGLTFSASGLSKGASGYGGRYEARNGTGALVAAVDFVGIERLVLEGKTVNIEPPAAPAVRVKRVSAASATSEAGGAVEYSVSLTRAPIDVVRVIFTSSDTTEGRVIGSGVSFTSKNWSVPQTVRVEGVDDYLDDGNIGYTVNGRIETTDLYYNRLTVAPANLVNNDDGLDKPLFLKGTIGVDILKGGNGGDRIWGYGDQDSVVGGRGDDTLYGNEDDDRLFGEDGNDRLYGGYDQDSLVGGAGGDSLWGEAGADTLVGGEGDDLLHGGVELDGDSMVGGAGNDTYFVDSVADRINDMGLASDVDTVLVLQAISYTLPTNVENAGIDGTGDANLKGNALNNGLRGNEGKNVLDGAEGNDRLSGGGGSDRLDGGVGNDSLAGGTGNDSLLGGAGVDWADFAAAGVDLKVDLTTGKVTGEGTDLLFDIENLVLGEGSDVVAGGAGANDLEGGTGEDSLSGGLGNDTLSGCAYGKGGGYAEVDTLVGGVGADVYELGWSGGRYYDDGVASSSGRIDYALIVDFAVGQDRLLLDGAAKSYFVGASGVAGVAGTGLFYDSNASGKFDATDELIAIVRSAGGGSVTAANVLGTAVWV